MIAELRRPGIGKAAFDKWKVKVAPALRVLLMVHNGQARSHRVNTMACPWRLECAVCASSGLMQDAALNGYVQMQSTG